MHSRNFDRIALRRMIMKDLALRQPEKGKGRNAARALRRTNNEST